MNFRTCHPERSAGSVFQTFADKQIPRCAREDKFFEFLRDATTPDNTMHDTALESREHRFRYVIYGGLLAGALDLVYICSFVAILYGIGPQRILHSVAVVMAIVYYLAAKRLPALVRYPWRYGALYGLALYLAMNYIVVPLSAAGDGTPKALQWIDLAHVAAHVLLVGIPCALASAFALGGRPLTFARAGA